MTIPHQYARKPMRGRASRVITISLADLPPEAREALARAKNRSALVREALATWARAGPEREALARIESMLRDISARLAALEAGRFAPVSPRAPAHELGDAARKAAAALVAWCSDGQCRH